MNKYALHESLGSGGYSKVYRCTDTVGIRYACKVLSKKDNRRLRVQKEIDIMKHLSHSVKVPRFIDACEDRDHYYIIQEWCRGGALREYVSSYDTYGENTAASIVRGVLRSLYHIHSAGVIHGDIKAANVFLADKSEDADVKVGDFGTAVFYDFDMVELDELIGTPWFMAPEVLSHQILPASDIWSTGVMTYQLLSGKMPFNDRANPLQPALAKIWRAILHDEPSFQSSVWKNISEEAKDFLRQCLVKDYRKRPSIPNLLTHPWLIKTECGDRFSGQTLHVTPFRYEESSIMNARTYVAPVAPAAPANFVAPAET